MDSVLSITKLMYLTLLIAALVWLADLTSAHWLHCAACPIEAAAAYHQRKVKACSAQARVQQPAHPCMLEAAAVMYCLYCRPTRS